MKTLRDLADAVEELMKDESNHDLPLIAYHGDSGRCLDASYLVIEEEPEWYEEDVPAKFVKFSVD